MWLKNPAKVKVFDHCLPCLDGFGDYQLSRYYLSINIDIRNKDQIVHNMYIIFHIIEGSLEVKIANNIDS